MIGGLKMPKKVKVLVKSKKTETIKNVGFGNRCSVCGTYFEDGVCSNGHQRGEFYPKTEAK